MAKCTAEGAIVALLSRNAVYDDLKASP